MPKIGTKNCRWYILSNYFIKNASKTLLKIQWLGRPSCLERRFTIYGSRSFVSEIQNTWTSGAPLPFTSVLGMGAFGWGSLWLHGLGPHSPGGQRPSDQCCAPGQGSGALRLAGPTQGGSPC